MPATIYKIVDAFLAAFTTFFTKLTGDFFGYFGINIGAIFPTIKDHKKIGLEAVLNSFNNGDSFFDKVFPGAQSFEHIFVVMAVCFCIMMMLINLMKSMVGPFAEGEHPIAAASRGMIALFASVFSYYIFLTIEYVMNKFYLQFHTTIVKKEGLEKTQELLFNKNVIMKIAGVESDSGAGMKLMVAMVALVAVILILFNFLKLLLSMIEQYVTLGIMFYTCPLAFGTLASASTRDIFKAWVRMVSSQCLLLISNLFFVNVFIYAINNIGKVFYVYAEVKQKTVGWNVDAKHSGAKTLFASTDKIGSGDIRLTIVSYIVVLCMLVAWLIAAQKFGDYLKSLGLNTVQSGRGLAGAVMATAGTTAFMTPRLVKSTVRAVGAVGGGGKKIYEHFNPKEDAKDPTKPPEKSTNNNNESTDNNSEGGEGSGTENQESARRRIAAAQRKAEEEVNKDAETPTDEELKEPDVPVGDSGAQTPTVQEREKENKENIEEAEKQNITEDAPGEQTQKVPTDGSPGKQTPKAPTDGAPSESDVVKIIPGRASTLGDSGVPKTSIDTPPTPDSNALGATDNSDTEEERAGASVLGASNDKETPSDKTPTFQGDGDSAKRLTNKAPNGNNKDQVHKEIVRDRDSSASGTDYTDLTKPDPVRSNKK